EPGWVLGGKRRHRVAVEEMSELIADRPALGLRRARPPCCHRRARLIEIVLEPTQGIDDRSSITELQRPVPVATPWRRPVLTAHWLIPPTMCPDGRLRRDGGARPCRASRSPA